MNTTTRDPKQPFRFHIIQKDGEIIHGGAESKELAIDHLRHCLRVDKTLVCWYTGRNGRAEPRRIRL